MPLKNKPVGSHCVDLLLSCAHIMIEPIEAAIFVPSIGEKRICPQCSKVSMIVKVGSPYWLDAPEEDQQQQKKK